MTSAKEMTMLYLPAATTMKYAYLHLKEQPDTSRGKEIMQDYCCYLVVLGYKGKPRTMFRKICTMKQEEAFKWISKTCEEYVSDVADMYDAIGLSGVEFPMTISGQ